MALPNPSIDAAESWLTSYYASTDTLSTRAWAEKHFHPHATFSLVNVVTCEGREEIVRLMEGRMGVMESMRHTVRSMDVLPSKLFVEVSIEYLIKDDPSKEPIHAKALAVFYKGVQEQRVGRVDVYGDFSKVQARVGIVKGMMQREEEVEDGRREVVSGGKDEANA